MRLPGAVLLIAIGLVLLWIVSTGRLDRMNEAWQYLSGATDAPGGNAGGVNQLISNTRTPLLDQILHTATFHVNATQAALSPSVNPTPGGMVG